MSTKIMKLDPLAGYLTGTCSATANAPAAVKKCIPSSMVGTSKFVGVLNGETVYLEGGSDWDRVGWNFPNTETAVNAAASTSIKHVMLTATLGVAIYIVATKLYAVAFTVGNGGALTFGSVATVNNADTGIFADICRITDSTYAIAYLDDGGDDYIFVRMGSVSGTTITQGDESASFSGAVAANVDDGVGICVPRSGVVTVVWTSAADTYGYCTAATYTTITVGTPGTAVEFATASQNSDLPRCASHATGYIDVAYQDGSNSDYLTLNTGTVSAAAVVAFGGTEEALNAAATTCIEISSPRKDSLVISWLDGGDPHMIAGGFVAASATAFVQGAETAIAGTFTDVCHTCISPTEVALAFCDDEGSDYGDIIRYSISWASTGAGTFTADSVRDVFAEASVKAGSNGVSVAFIPNKDAVVAVYTDTGNSSYLTASYGEFRDDIIDIRSAAASATYSLWLSPVYDYVKTN